MEHSAIERLLDTNQWEKVTSINLVRLTPLGDCVVTLAIADGRGIVFRIFDPDRSLDRLTGLQAQTEQQSPALSILALMGTKIKTEAKGVYFSASDSSQWQVDYLINLPEEPSCFRGCCSPKEALALFGRTVPIFIEKDNPALCDLTGHHEALVFGLRGGADVKESLQEMMLKDAGITIEKTEETSKNAAPVKRVREIMAEALANCPPGDCEETAPV